MEQEKDKPARIVRPGAETKVGGWPITTIGFKLLDVVLRLLLWILLLLSTSKEEEEERVVLLRGWEDGESGTVEFIHSDAIVLILWWYDIVMFPFTLKE